MSMQRVLVSGNEAIALAARDAGVALGTGYPGTPSTEILEYFSEIGGKAQWAPNEKVALEVALGAAFGKARALATMKHVGLNVAADVLFTAAYTGVSGALVIVSADDPGMWSSQNEQDNRNYAKMAGVPMVEPADSQEAYDFTLAAFEISERWGIPVLLRVTTRVCHSKSILVPRAKIAPPRDPGFERDLRGRVMIPMNARPAHRRLRAKLAEIAEWGETCGLHKTLPGDPSRGIISSGAAAMHAREAAPDRALLKLGLTYPLPFGLIRDFVNGIQKAAGASSLQSPASSLVQVIEENDPYLYESIRAAGIEVQGRPEMYRFGELNVARVRRILAGDTSPETAPRPGKPPELCAACAHRPVYETLKKLDCIVPGDIGCYSLGVLPPYEWMDTLVCMGAGVTNGLGLRHVLPPDQARRVVSVIGDSTFAHSGVPGLIEMVYNPPPTGHVVLILDNGTTAMTGQQEHPGTGRDLKHQATGRLVFEDVARALGIPRVHVIDAVSSKAEFESVLAECLASGELCVIVARRACILAAGKIKEYEKQCAPARV